MAIGNFKRPIRWAGTCRISTVCPFRAVFFPCHNALTLNVENRSTEHYIWLVLAFLFADIVLW